MTPTHHTRDGRPVTIDHVGKRWMHGWIVNLNDRNIRWRDKWRKTGSHSFEADMDLTPVANAHLTAIIARARDLFDDTPEPDPRDAEIERLRGVLDESMALFRRWYSGAVGDHEVCIFLARNGGAK